MTPWPLPHSPHSLVFTYHRPPIAQWWWETAAAPQSSWTHVLYPCPPTASSHWNCIPSLASWCLLPYWICSKQHLQRIQLLWFSADSFYCIGVINSATSAQLSCNKSQIVYSTTPRGSLICRYLGFSRNRGYVSHSFCLDLSRYGLLSALTSLNGTCESWCWAADSEIQQATATFVLVHREARDIKLTLILAVANINLTLYLPLSSARCA